MSRLSELTAELVGIDSVNPALVAGGAGEAEIARFVARWLDEAGLDVEASELAPGRWNVVAVARGSGGGRTLLLNAHMDTVGYEGMKRPLDPEERDGRLFGRGAYDMKASLAAIMLAGAEAAGANLSGDVVVAAVCDEEAASIGSEAVAAAVSADACIVAEPTEERLAVAHKGFVWLDVETRGRAAHGSRPDLGVDAIARMGRVLTGLESLGAVLGENPSHRLLGSGSVHAGLIEGGQELSTYPERCLLKVERRTVPGETPDLVERQIASLLDGVDGSVRVTLVRPPFEVAEDEPIVELVRRHAGGPQLVGVPFWADSALFAEAGIPTVLFGPKGEGAHALEEWVDLASAERCLGLYSAAAAELCA